MFLLYNRKMRALYRDKTGRPVKFESKQDASWLVRSWEQDTRDWVVVKLARPAARGEVK